MRALLAKLVPSLRARGFMRTIRQGAEALRWRWERRLDAAFDRRFDTDTSGTIPVDSLDTPDAARSHSARYQPSDAATFARMIDRLPIRHAAYTFVDLGSGKGRALMLAAQRPYRGLVGVECSRSLHAIAQRNVAAFSRRTGRSHPFQLHCADAGAFELPPGPLVVYLYNPFGPAVLCRIVERLRSSLACSPRHVVVAYRNPKHAGVLDRCEFLDSVETTPAYRIWEHRPRP